MSIASLIQYLKHKPCVRITGLEGSSLAYVLARTQVVLKQPFLIVVPTEEQVQKLAQMLRFFIEPPVINSPFEQRVFTLPEEPFMPYTGLSPRPEVLGKHFAGLFGLLNADKPVVVTTPKVLMSFFVPKQAFQENTQIYQKGEEIPREAFITFLQRLGYERVSLVEGIGEFSVRGDIIDIFCPLYTLPLRLEFFGDVLESIRLFNPISQRSENYLEDFILIQTNPIPREERAFIEAKHRLNDSALLVEIKEKVLSFLEVPVHQPGIEGFFPLFYEKTHTLFDYLPPDILMIMVEPEQIENQARGLEKAIKSHLAELEAERKPSLPVSQTIISWKDIQKKSKSYKKLFCHTLAFLTHENIPTVEFSPKKPFAHLTPAEKHARFRSELENWLKMGLCVVLTASHPLTQRRLARLLETWNLPAVTATPPFTYKPGLFVYRGELEQGFLMLEEKLVILGEKDWQIKGEPLVALPRRDYKDLLPVSSFEDLKEGDLLVHVEHGIGRYQGLKTITTGGTTAEFLVLVYQDGDKLYLPVDKLHLVQKYRGVEDKEPPLDKLGGRTWAKTKRHVKKAVEKIAKELLELYAKRMAQPGYAFSPPDGMFNQFVASFPYTETPDQKRAIDDVMADMLKPRPMDRLICGDVGFGKTEVAVRAAFKAVLDGKQVAVLVPTTILAEQHYLTFKERLEAFGVNIACLNRFRSTKEQRAILKKLKKGEIDVIIGTHRLLQNDVEFKDLGLLIIDEEHRFGVKQKEHLKALKATVDVLTLSATPIPRTLYLSLLGVRDLSLIETPPPGRRPVKTYLSKFNLTLIKDAIQRELARGGQVFFIHPRVRGLNALARFLKKLLPEVRLGLAHGQMRERELEKEMLKFLHHEVDVLLCTSIVESGLDIPNANTIIINRADMFGLAQLYHLRGRVGRSPSQAYAYLLVPGEKLITQEAQKRLRALLEHTELSSGYKLAMHDLRMRGAGNILGMAQSGHIAAVGYEMYLELLQKAVQELKGEIVPEKIEPEIKLRLVAYIPESYIPDKTQRVVFYKRLSQIKNEAELEELRTEMKDRFGNMPEAVEHLFKLVELRLWCIHFRIKRLDSKDGLLRFTFAPDNPISPQQMIKFLAQRPSYRFTPKGELLVPLKKKNILKKIEKVMQGLQEENKYTPTKNWL
ncbi:MAG: transcription-repair coupling factor [Candidatus Desulfofervidaceae bacterium]|nr:transcription-repair coupling factor [Candidatus Desulfofervidaceae bacterium]